MDFPFYTRSYTEAARIAEEWARNTRSQWRVWQYGDAVYIVSPKERGQPWGCELCLDYEYNHDPFEPWVEQIA